jgi:hypothetical protein
MPGGHDGVALECRAETEPRWELPAELGAGGSEALAALRLYASRWVPSPLHDLGALHLAGAREARKFPRGSLLSSAAAALLRPRVPVAVEA